MEIEALTPCQALVLCSRSYGGEDEVAGAAGGVEGKPRIVLMGLRRYVRMQSSHFVYVCHAHLYATLEVASPPFRKLSSTNSHLMKHSF